MSNLKLNLILKFNCWGNMKKIYFFFISCCFSLFVVKSNSQTMNDIYDVMPDVANCKAGTIKTSEKQSVLLYVNLIRGLHGLNPVTYNNAGDVDAQNGALITVANQQLNHTPPSSYSCYSQSGYNGNAKSNLYIYMQGGSSTLQESRGSLIAWMIDENTPELGHRRAIINPFLTAISFGRVDGNTKTGQYKQYFTTGENLYYQPYVNGTSNVDFVACPQNNYPPILFQKDWLLSFSAIADKSNWAGNFASVDYKSVEITVKDSKGVSLAVSDISSDNDGWGSLGNQVAWKTAGLKDEVKYTVTVKNVKVNGVNKDYTYDFTLTNNISGGETAPTTPILALPANNSVDTETEITLKWGKVDKALVYNLRIAKDADFNSLVVSQDGQTTTEYVLGSLENNTSYFWKIQAQNDKGTSEWSETWSFKTKEAPLQQPSLTKPEDNAILSNTGPIFTWSTVANALSYHLQVAIDNSFDENKIVMNKEGLSSTTYTNANSSLNTNKDYFWRVRGVDSKGNGTWSNSRKFTTGSINSVENEKEFTYNVFPNPTSDKVTIQTNDFKFTNLKLVDIFGNTIKNYNFSDLSNNYTLELQNIASGLYFVYVSNSNNLITIPIVKK